MIPECGWNSLIENAGFKTPENLIKEHAKCN
jgi:hypothetical protein